MTGQRTAPSPGEDEDPLVRQFRRTTRFGYPMGVALMVVALGGTHLWHAPRWSLWVTFGVAVLLVVAPAVRLVAAAARQGRQEAPE